MEIGKIHKRSVRIDVSRCFNKHLLITGKSGSGKTVFAQKIVLETVKEGGTVLAFDWHHTLAQDQIFPEFENAFKDNLNEVNAGDSGISFPLFMTSDVTKKIDPVHIVTEIFGRVFTLGSRQRATFRKAVALVSESPSYRKKGFPALKNALEEIGTEVAEILLDKLEPLFYYNVFREGDLFLKEGKINILRLSCFDPALQQVVVESLLSYFWSCASFQGGTFPPLCIFVDECHNLSLGKTSALAQILSEGRKFNIQLLLATQSLSMAYSSAEQKRLLQAGTQIFFRPPENENQAIARMLKRENSHELSILLRRLQIGEFLAVGELIFGNQRMEGPIKLNNL